MKADKQAIYTMHYAFRGGWITIQQWNLLFQWGIYPLKIMSFGVIAIPLQAQERDQALQEASDKAHALNEWADECVESIDIGREVCLSDDADYWRGWANKARGLSQPIVYPYYEVKKGMERLVSVGQDPEERFASLHKRTKVALVGSNHGDLDIYSYDIVFVIPEGTKKSSYVHVLAGGGGGLYGGSAALAPRLADWLGGYSVDDALHLGLYLLELNKKYGETENPRKRRLKSTLGVHGLEWLGEQLHRSGFQLRSSQYPQMIYSDVESRDNGAMSTIIPIEQGIIDGKNLGGLWNVFDTYREKLTQSIQITPHGHIRFSDEDRDIVCQMREALHLHGVNVDSTTRLHSFACRGLKLCKKAKAESSTVLLSMVTMIDKLMVQHQRQNQRIVFRISGCPNGCSRPLFAELALIGRKEGIYDIFVGGHPQGNRLARLWKKAVPYEDIEPIFSNMFGRYAKESEGDFGTWSLKLLEELDSK